MGSNENNYIQRLKKGKEDALDYIVGNYLTLVKGTVNKILGQFNDEGIIEECINDVFLSIWNNSKSFNGDSTNFKKWVYSISKFKAVDFYRAKVRKVEIVLETVEISKGSVEDDFISEENRNEVLKIINSLDFMDRNIFIMKFFLGYKAEEIALKLGITKASVDNRIYRGKRKLREKALDLKLEVI